MKKIYKLLVIILFCNAALALPAGAEFVEGIEDIPVMGGLHQLHNDNVAFGNEEARFVEAYFSSPKLTFKQVGRFYRDTLPQLGWKLVKDSRRELLFERDMENLRIVGERTSPLLLRITLTSKD